MTRATKEYSSRKQAASRAFVTDPPFVARVCGPLNCRSHLPGHLLQAHPPPLALLRQRFPMPACHPSPSD
eukprot:2241079-Rhodomonas_salina.2